MSATETTDKAIALRDERLVTLAEPALLVAAELGGARVMPGWPAKDATGVEFLPEQERIRFRFGHGGNASMLDMGGAQLAALVIGYLIGIGVPMPSRAPKRITVLADAVRLRLSTQHEVAPRRKPAPLKVRF